MATDTARAEGMSRPILDAEAIVVGSGFGGAVAACRLAQAAVGVLVLERGRRYEAGDFPALPGEDELLPDMRRWTWRGSQGLWDVLDLEEVVAVQAAGWGGGSLVYASVHLRPPEVVFDQRWPAIYRGGSELQRHYDLAAHMLEVEPASAHPEFLAGVVKAEQLRRAAAHLNRETFHPPLALRYAGGPNGHGTPRGACDLCGECCTGCSRGAKNTLDATYLAVAERNGAQVRTQCEVTGLRALDGAGWEVECIDHLQAATVRLRCRWLFLCAGSVHSTRLLARARLPKAARPAQALVGVGYFPGGDAVGMVYDAAHAQYPCHGPTITTAIVHWEADRPGSFFLLEDGGYGRAVERVLGVLRAPLWLGRNRLSRAGKAAVEASQAPPPAPAAAQAGAGGGVRPPLDALLDAVARGDFRSVLSRDASRALSAFLDELKVPLLLPETIEATLVRALRERFRRLPILRHLDPDGPVLRVLMRAAKSLAFGTMGDASSIAGHALRAGLHAADLSRAEVAARVLGYEDRGGDRRTLLLAMGRDAAPGQLHYDPRRDRLVADLDLFHLAPGYAREEQLMTDVAVALGGELRTNPAWAFLGKPVTVHNQGGCRMSDSPEHGVTTDEGQVRGCDGLFVLDGALLPASVGANPSATILALAERNVLAFVRRLRTPSWPEGDASPGAEEYRRHLDGARAWAQRASAEGWQIRPPQTPPVDLRSRPLGLSFQETMQGYYEPTARVPRGDEAYRRHEAAGCPDHPLRLDLDVAVENLSAFLEDERHRMHLSGTVTLRLPGASRGREERCPAKGALELLVPRTKRHAIRDPRRRAAQEAATGHPYTARPGEPDVARDRFLKYRLSFRDAAGQDWGLWGYKRIRRQAGVDPWRATSSLFCRLGGPFPASGAAPGRPGIRGAGVVHVALTSFLHRQLPSMRVTGTEDPARITWALARFTSFFFGNLQRIYLPEVGAALDAALRAQLGDPRHHPR